MLAAAAEPAGGGAQGREMACVWGAVGAGISVASLGGIASPTACGHAGLLELPPKEKEAGAHVDVGQNLHGSERLGG